MATGHRRRPVSVVDAEIPGRLRAERERRKISVRELARRLNVSPSAISQIETGRARPSVSTLYAIVTELDISLDELFHPDGAARRPRAAGADAPARPDAPASPVVDEATRETIELESGVRWERLTAAADPDVDFLYVTYDVGGSSGVDGRLMRHPGREYGLVLSGQLEVTVGFETHVLGPGNSISFESTIPHRLSNVGDEPVTGVWMVIGRRGTAPPPLLGGDRPT